MRGRVSKEFGFGFKHRARFQSVQQLVVPLTDIQVASCRNIVGGGEQLNASCTPSAFLVRWLDKVQASQWLHSRRVGHGWMHSFCGDERALKSLSME